jgi:Domain of unknown function (DUF3597)
MGMFHDLMSKIFNHAGASAAGTGAQSSGTQPGGAGTTMQPGATGAPAGGAAPASSAPATTPVVDVAAVLDGLAGKNPEKLDWRHSIVDLMKLVGMDSSLSARKQLATDLHYSGDENDSASMNIWLHKEVLQKLSQNGGKVPPELLK